MSRLWTRTRKPPPGRGSRVAAAPFHRTYLAGSVSKAKIVSGLAPTRTSRLMALRSSTVICGSLLTESGFVLPPAAIPLSALLSFRFLLQTVQALVPECLQEPPHFGHGVGPGAIEAARTLPAFAHQPCLLEHPQVLRNRRTRHCKVEAVRHTGMSRGPNLRQYS